MSFTRILNTTKNYIPNGNFEASGTTGWSLFNTTFSSGRPTGTISAGASSLTTFTTTTTNPLSGTRSLQIGASGVWQAQDGVISDAFSVDREDFAKVLQFSINYEIVSGTSNINFSGTVLNSIAIYLYNVTTSTWEQPSGCFGMTQSTGAGKISGTFQTPNSASNYRLVILGLNATAGAVTINFDTVSVSPQSVTNGAAVTDPVAYTPTFTGFGTVSGVEVTSWRDGAYLCIDAKFTSGTPTATEGRMTLGFGGVSGNVTSSSTVLSSIKACGTPIIFDSSSGTNNYIYIPLIEPSVGYITFGGQTTTTAGLTKINGSTLLGAGGKASFTARVPIVGWSSNVQLSSDTDTRVVAARYSNTSAQSIPNNATTAVTGWTKIADTHGAFNTATGVFTAPVSGLYRASLRTSILNAVASAGVISSYITQAGSASTSSLATVPFGNTQVHSSQVTDTFSMIAGDTLTTNTYQNNGAAKSLTANAYDNTFSVERLSGPATIAASESVNGLYTDTASGAISAAVNTYTFATKVRDTHSAYVSGTLTIPVSGMYNFAVQITTAAQNLTVGGTQQLYIYRNGTSISSATIIGVTTASITYSNQTSVTYPCVAGDLITVRIFNSTTSTLSGTAGLNNFSWARVGN